MRMQARLMVARMLCGVLLMLAWQVSGALAFQIAEPKDGATVKAGEAMKVKVGIPLGLPVTQITYTLFEEGRAPDDKVEAPPSMTSNAAPFDIDMPVPLEAAGGMRLLAVAHVRERRGEYILFDEVTFRVDPGQLVGLQLQTPVRFSQTLGEVQFLSVRGKYADKVVRDVTPGHAGTSYRSNDEKIVRINPDGRAQAVGLGTTTVSVKNDGKEDTIRVVVSPENPDNLPPVANAGSDQTVRQGTRVRLDALLSGDPEGKNPLYYWSQVRGMPVLLQEPLSPRPSFMAPVVSVPRVLRFRLIVKDEEGAEGFPAYVNVTVMP